MKIKDKATKNDNPETIDQMMKGILDQVMLLFISLKHLSERLERIKITTNVSQEWMTREEVSKYLDISKGTLAQWGWKKQGIPYTRVGKMVRYKTKDVEKFLHQGKKISITK